MPIRMRPSTIPTSDQKKACRKIITLPEKPITKKRHEHHFGRFNIHFVKPFSSWAAAAAPTMKHFSASHRFLQLFEIPTSVTRRCLCCLSTFGTF
jgi:hypothetical protein